MGRQKKERPADTRRKGREPDDVPNMLSLEPEWQRNVRLGGKPKDPGAPSPLTPTTTHAHTPTLLPLRTGTFP